MHTCFNYSRFVAVIALAVGLHAKVSGAERQLQTNRWESDIRAFEAADKTNSPPRNAILFLGSSSIRLWPDLQQAFPKHQIIKRGFGGSELSDSVTFADRIVIPYRPNMILLYAGDNDIAVGKMPERVFSDFKAFVQKVRAALPETRIAFIAIKPCPARRQFLNEVKATNQLIHDYAAANSTVLFVDVYTPMLNPDGSMRPELFVQDGLHLNAKGYSLWNSIVTPLLDKYDMPGRGN